METVRNRKFNITHVDTPDDLAVTAFEMFINHAKKAIESGESFKVAISGGQTPKGFFELLGSQRGAEAIRWDKVELFWVDERCVGPDAEASNYRLAAETFLNKVPIPDDNVHRMPGESGDYAQTMRAYEDVIRRVFNLTPAQIPQFDLIILGMGPDGHIGSLFRNSYALFDTNDLVSVVYCMDGDYNRITLTHPVLCAAAHLVILVSGPEKAGIIKEVLQSEQDQVKYPVHTLWPILDKVTWVIDSEADRLL